MPFKVIRFLKDHPIITGVDNVSYGPFLKGIEYALPIENANELAKLKIAEDTKKKVEEPSLKQVFKGEVLAGYIEAAKTRTLNLFSGDELELLERIKAIESSGFRATRDILHENFRTKWGKQKIDEMLESLTRRGEVFEVKPSRTPLNDPTDWFRPRDFTKPLVPTKGVLSELDSLIEEMERDKSGV